MGRIRTGDELPIERLERRLGAARCGVFGSQRAVNRHFVLWWNPTTLLDKLQRHLAARCQRTIPLSRGVLVPTVFYSGTILQFCNFRHITGGEPPLA